LSYCRHHSLTLRYHTDHADTGEKGKFHLLLDLDKDQVRDLREMLDLGFEDYFAQLDAQKNPTLGYDALAR
jgi:hypothetical protein